MDCKTENIGTAIPDIAGVGIILAFAILAGLSLLFAGIGYYVTLQAKSIHPDASGDEISDNNWKTKRAQFFRVQRLDLTEKVLGSISEVQLFNGIALLIAAMVQRNSLSLYHLHVVYDTVNFTAVSFTASMFVVWLSRKIRTQNGEDMHQAATLQELLQIRRLPSTAFLVSTSIWIVVFCLLYLVYVILFGIALGRWNIDKFGYCYRDRGITSPNEPHPEADLVYLGITSLYMFVLLYQSYMESHEIPVLTYSFWFTLIQKKYNTIIGAMSSYEKQILDRYETLLARFFDRFPITMGTDIKHLLSRTFLTPYFGPRDSGTELAFVLLPLGQYLLHLYMVLAIRSANRMHLQGESEDTWGFGQVVALIQILPILKGCTKDCMGKTAVRNLRFC